MAEEFFNFGLTSLMEDNTQTAIEYLTKSLERNPESSDSHLYRGIAYFKFGDYLSSISDLNNAEKLVGKSYFVLYNRAKAYFYNQEFSNGINDLNDARNLGNLSEEQLDKINALLNRFS
jgi:tetratricopeptide (TPR) repeat protein